MTFSVVPYALQNGSHSADLFRQATSSLIPPGGGIVTVGDFNVTETGTPSMNVSIGVGRIWIPGTNVGNVSGGNFSSQAMYYGQNDAAYTASVDTSDPVNPRIDVVYAAVKDSQYAGSLDAGELAVVAGVPTSGATYPTHAPAIPNNAIAVAWIAVAANAASIVNDNITRLVSAPSSPAASAKGLMARHIMNSTDSTAVTALASLGNRISSFDFKAGRKYRIGFEGNYYVSDTSAVLLLKIGTCAPTDADALTTGVTVLNQTDFQATSATRGFPCNLSYSSFEPSSDVTLKIKLLAQRIVGSGDIFFQRSAVTPATIYIEDLGAQF